MIRFIDILIKAIFSLIPLLFAVGFYAFTTINLGFIFGFILGFKIVICYWFLSFFIKTELE